MQYGMTVFMLNSNLNEWINFIFIDEEVYQTYWTLIMCCLLQKKIPNIHVRNEQDYFVSCLKAGGGMQ
jgi:hypothetical protein